MQIGTVAKSIGVSVDAIRFYERNELLPLAPRTGGGFRQYGSGDVETLRFIRRAKGLGFTLTEIRELLEIRRKELRACRPVRRRLQQKLACVRLRLVDMKGWSRS
jgi:MerR family copper efflux transcriptional regulator